MTRTTRLLHLLVLALVAVPSVVVAALPREPADLEAAPRSRGVPHSGPGDSFVGDPTVRVSMHDVPLAPARGFGPVGAVVQGELAQGGEPAARVLPDPLDAEPPSDDRLDPSARGVAEQLDFDGIDTVPSDRIPPDTALAVSHRHALEAVNRGFAVYSKLGNEIRGYTLLDTFFADVIPAGFGGTLFDPRVVWSEEHERFVLFALGKDEEEMDSYGFLAVSATDDPLGDWYLHRIGLAIADLDTWWDYASLGVDENGIVLTGNLFFWEGGFEHAIVLSILPSAFDGDPLEVQRWRDLQWPDGQGTAFGLQVAHPHSVNSNDETFLVNNFHRGGDDVVLWTIGGDRTSTTGQTLTGTSIATATYSPIDEQVRQPDTPLRIHGGDARLLGAVYSNRRIYTTATTDPLGLGEESGIFLLHLHTDLESNLWDAVRWSPDVYYFFPAITVFEDSTTGPGIVFASYTSVVNGNPRYASARTWVFTDWGSSTGTVSTVTGDGQDTYYVIGNGTRNRWGDYSAATWDFDCGMAWGAAEYAGARDFWATRITALEIEDPPTCRLLDLTSHEDVVHGAGDATTITWDAFRLVPGEPISLSWSVEGGFPQPIVSGLPWSATSYSWSLPNVDSEDVVVTVRQSDGLFETFAIASSDVPFTIEGLPNLAFRSTQSPPIGEAGGQIEVTYSVENDGSVALPSSTTLEIRLSTNDFCSTSDQLLATRTVAAIGPGHQAAALVTLGLPDVTGPRYLCFMADRPDDVDEYDEGDNVVAVPITLEDGILFLDDFESGDTTAWEE